MNLRFAIIGMAFLYSVVTIPSANGNDTSLRSLLAFFSNLLGKPPLELRNDTCDAMSQNSIENQLEALQTKLEKKYPINPKSRLGSAHQNAKCPVGTLLQYIRKNKEVLEHNPRRFYSVVPEDYPYLGCGVQFLEPNQMIMTLFKEQFSKGVMKEARLAVDISSMKPYVLYDIPVPGNMLRDAFIGLVSSEAEVSKRIRHPYVASGLILSTNSLAANEPIMRNRFVAIQELYDGGNLLRPLVELDAQQKLRIANQLIEALQYLHTHNISHNDIKPDNLYLKINSRNEVDVVIGDLGYTKT